ncbi:MAG: PQQ-dependent sugar dehydrogenase [Acidimicrobiia bacterium]
MKVVVVGALWFVAALSAASLVGWTVESAPCSAPDQTLETTSAVEGEGEPVRLQAEPVAEGLTQPSDMFTLPARDELFVVEKPGTIVMVENGHVAWPPVLDMRSLVLNEGNEQGLLTVRPDPRFTESCRLFIFYTDKYGDSQLASIRLSGTDSPTADLRSLRHILEIPQRQAWHQSGSMIFGPEGNLWISVGDGGGIGDPHGFGQNPKRLEGSILRLDVDTSSYRVPVDNPFAYSSAGRPEVWAFGLRNPWRLSIDEESGLLFIPDVGQEDVEELDIVDWREPGLNFGWSVTEGAGCYREVACDTDGFTEPMYEYEHDGNGCAIVGGQVYRGRAIPELDGQYFFADFCQGWIKSLTYQHGEITSMTEWTDLGRHPLLTSFAVDAAGEIYFMTLDGGLWKIAPDRAKPTG